MIFFLDGSGGNDFFDLNRLGHRKKGGFGKDFAQNALSLGLRNIVSFYHLDDFFRGRNNIASLL